MRRQHVIALVLGALGSSHARAASPAPRSAIVTDSFFGGAHTSVAIEVPAFHGIEPRLALGYSSSSGSGFAGVGWSLSGFSTIERASAGQGTPRYAAGDSFVLDGQELVACAPGMTSPSCASGGTHATKTESYRRIRYDAGTQEWVVTGPDGTVQTYRPLYVVAAGTFRWGLVSVRDPKGNSVSYGWWCDPSADCFPRSITYGGYVIDLFSELRSDVRYFANGEYIGASRYRLRSVVVRAAGVSPIRAYKLAYATGGTGRSMLVSVQQYGRDVIYDQAGAITGGTALPASTFEYQTDAATGTFTLTPPVASPPGTIENVAWFGRRCAEPDATSLWKPQTYECNTNNWDAGASSTKAIVSGDGYMEFSDGCRNWWHTDIAAGLSSRGITWWEGAPATYTNIDYAIVIVDDPDPDVYDSSIQIYERGVYKGTFGTFYHGGDVFRVAVSGGVVRYFRNGVVFYTSTQPPTYPLRAASALRGTGNSGVSNVKIAGALVDLAGFCSDDERRIADYNGDGKSDVLCYQNGITTVRLGNGAGFDAPATWSTAARPEAPLWGTGDFDADGKSDLWQLDVFSGDVAISRSTGTTFAAPASWGSNGVCRVDASQFRVSTGDFNRDGATDMLCLRYAGDAQDGVYVGLSTGSSFSHARWEGAGCRPFDAFGAADFDGDGRDDLSCIHATGSAEFYRSTGSTFVPAALAGTYIAAGNCAAGSWAIMDANSDGSTDFVCRDNGEAFLSTGSGFWRQGASQGFCNANALEQLVPGDVNGDGLADLVCNHAGAPANDIEVRLATGRSFAAPTTWRGSWCAGKVLAIDFDADRKTDLYCDDSASRIGFAGTQGAIPDLMTLHRDSLGATTRLTYAPSSTFPNTNNPPVVPVVTQTDVSDGRGQTATTRYAYAGGLMDRRERRYLGFRYAKETLPCNAGETACPYREITFRQDYGSAAKPERTDRRDGQGRLLRSAVDTYQTNGATVPYTSLLVAEWSYEYDGSGATCPTWPCNAGKRSHVVHAYDAYGNRTRTDRYGDSDVAGDETTDVTTFRPNATAFIVARPAVVSRFAGLGTSGTLLSQTLTYYDGATTWDVPPTQGYPTKELRWLDTNNSYVATATGYDAWGNVVTHSNAIGATTTIAYDTTYHVYPIAMTNAVGEQRSMAWNAACAAPERATDANGQAFTTKYDALCRPIRTDGPLGAFESRSYVGYGDPTAQYDQIETASSAADDSSPLWKRVYFDGLGRRYRRTSKGATSAGAVYEDTSFTPRGQPATTSAPYRPGLGETPQLRRLEYDALDRPTRTTHPDNATVTKSYGLRSVTTFDEHGHPATERYDANGRIIEREERIDDHAVVTRMTYDRAGNLTGMTDPIGAAWAWQFDSLSRIVRKTDPDAGTWRATYDAAGRVLTETDASGNVKRMTYDLVGRPIAKTSDAGVAAFAYGEARLGYFNAAQLTTMTDDYGRLELDYDALGHPVRMKRTLDGVAYQYTLGYDVAGQLATLTFPDGETVSYQYDAANQVRAVPGIVTQLVYDARGAVARQTNANGTVTTRSYSPSRGWLTNITTTTPSGSTIQRLTYARDAAGLVTRVDSPFADESWAYSFDAVHRLTAAKTTLDDLKFQYDDGGRMVFNSKVGSYDYASSDTASMAHAHAPIAIRPCLGCPATTTIDYNANGAATAITGTGADSYAWNADRRLTSTNASQMRYDGFGQRLSRFAASSRSLYPLGDNYEITDGVVTKYIPVPGVGIVARRTGAELAWLHTDLLGSVQSVTNATGHVDRLTYAPYGEQLSGPAESRSWLMQRRDPASELTYLHERYYNPKLGLFVSPDPSHPALAGVGTNRYAYALSSPTSFIDPGGLRAKKYDCNEDAGFCRSQEQLDVTGTLDEEPVHPTPVGWWDGGAGAGGGSSGGGGGAGNGPELDEGPRRNCPFGPGCRGPLAGILPDSSESPYPDDPILSEDNTDGLGDAEGEATCDLEMCSTSVKSTNRTHPIVIEGVVAHEQSHVDLFNWHLEENLAHAIVYSVEIVALQQAIMSGRYDLSSSDVLYLMNHLENTKRRRDRCMNGRCGP